jgi:hypothetical protein
LAATCIVCAFSLSSVALAQTPTSAPKGEGVIASSTVTATVTSVNQATREVTVKTDDGRDLGFIAGPDVKNLAQVKPGDVLTATYSEALVYEVKKGGVAVAPAVGVAGGSAKLGEKPAGGIAQQATVTVLITAIDRSVPSVTFKGPKGTTKTIKVKHPEKLEGVSVGDTVEITYTEALAVKVEAAPKQ